MVCVNEAGWDVGDDCPAIYAVLKDRMERTGHDFKSISHAYSRSTFNRHKVSRGWTAYLNRNGTKPAHWPSNLDWENNYKQKWLDVLTYAQRIIDGEVHARCAPHHWGANEGTFYESSKQRPGWHEIDCGHTENAFFRVDALTSVGAQ